MDDRFKKRFNNALQEGDTRCRAIVEAVTDYLYTISLRDGEVVFMIHNAQCVVVTGFTTEEYANDSNLWTRVVHEDDRLLVFEFLRKSKSEGVYQSLEHRIIHKDGSVRWVKNTIIPYKNDESGIDSYDGIVKDITDRIRVEEKLESSVSVLQAAIESTADGLLVVDLQGNIVCHNQRFITMWQIPEHLMKSGDGIKVFEYGIKQLRFQEECKRNVLESFINPDRESFKILKFKDGRMFERFSIPQKIGNKLVGIAWSYRDVTGQRRLEEQLRQSQKMEAIGRLSGGIAHDFNNLLTAMSNYLFLFKRKLPTHFPLRKYVDNISDCIEKASYLIQNLLAFSRKQVINPLPVKVNDLVNGVSDILRKLVGEDIVLAVIPSKEDLRITVDRILLEQVLMNLATNARDAMPDGGFITVTTESADLDEDFMKKHGYGNAGKYAILAISDTGQGIRRENQKNIFEPFFTTKDIGKGSGLGLSTAYGIIKQHGGFINVYSEEGMGTTFRIYFPITLKQPIINTTLECLTEITTGGETILLAEDEDRVREATRELLEEYGYQVIVGKDGWDALQKFSAHKDQIDLCIFDVVMPNMNGKSVYEQIQVEKPDVKVIFMSGYTADIIDRNGIVNTNVHFISKPFPSMSLLQKTVEVLG